MKVPFYRTAIKKQGNFNSVNRTFCYILHKKQKNLTRRIIKGPLNSIISKHFKMNLR